MMKRFGVDATIQHTPSMALGTAEVTLKDLTGAYNQLASGGLKKPPRTILSIKDSDGKTIFEAEPQERKDEEQIMKADDAFILTHLMTGMFDPAFVKRTA